MSIERILGKIDEDSAEAVRRVIEEAEAEARRIAGRYEAAAAKLRSELEELAGRKAADEKRRLIVAEELELRKAALVKKREILSDLYDEAKGTIGALSGGEYLDLLVSLVAARAVSGREEIVPAAGQRGLLDNAFLAKLGASFEGDARFSVARDEGTFTWGVVLREGKRTVDLSLETLFKQVGERLEPDVSAILFAGGRGD